MFLRRKKTKTDLLKEQVHELTGKAVETAGRAATALAPTVDLASEAAVGAYESASSKVRDEYAPRAAAAAAPAVASALTKAALLRPTSVEPPKRKSHGRLKKLLVVTGVGGVGFAVAKRVRAAATSVPPVDVVEPVEAESTTPFVDKPFVDGDANPAGGDDGHSSGR